MPKKVAVKKFKAQKFDKVKIKRAENRLMKKWDDAIYEAVDWLEQIDLEDAPERDGDGYINEIFRSVYGIIRSLAEALEEVRGFISDVE